jgi:hypothetical protein
MVEIDQTGIVHGLEYFEIELLGIASERMWRVNDRISLDFEASSVANECVWHVNDLISLDFEANSVANKGVRHVSDRISLEIEPKSIVNEGQEAKPTPGSIICHGRKPGCDAIPPPVTVDHRN